MLNLLTSVTNFTAYYPIAYAMQRKDYLTASTIALAAGASIISHLFESHKHNMWGFGTNVEVSYYLNRMDVVGVVLTVSRCAYLWYQSNLGVTLFKHHFELCLAAAGAYICNLISEQDSGYYYYLPLHCIWHMSIFLILQRFLILVI